MQRIHLKWIKDQSSIVIILVCRSIATESRIGVENSKCPKKVMHYRLFYSMFVILLPSILIGFDIDAVERTKIRPYLIKLFILQLNEVEHPISIELLFYSVCFLSLFVYYFSALNCYYSCPNAR